MTISYSTDVATAKLATLGRLIFRWKASVYKLIWRELLIFVFLYVGIAVIYRHVLTGDHQRRFTAFVQYCRKNHEVIPLTFVMGFYVAQVIARWWGIFGCISWPDRACYFLSMCLTSPDQETLEIRRAIARYLNLAQLLVLRDVSTSVRTRYPTLDRVVEDKFMTSQEKQILDNLEGDLKSHHKFWLVMQWATTLLRRAHDNRKVRDKVAYAKAMFQIVTFRDKLGLMLAYDWVSIPLSYTQVVTLVNYVYFATALFGRQYLIDGNSDAEAGDGKMPPSITEEYRVIEKYCPIFPIMEFLFYCGWMKVAESIMNPLGQDDDDFEINYIINRNISVSYGIVDTYRDSCVPLQAEILPEPVETNIQSKSYRGSASQYMPRQNPDGTEKRAHRRKLFRSRGARDHEEADGPKSVEPPSSYSTFSMTKSGEKDGWMINNQIKRHYLQKNSVNYRWERS